MSTSFPVPMILTCVTSLVASCMSTPALGYQAYITPWALGSWCDLYRFQNGRGIERDLEKQITHLEYFS